MRSSFFCIILCFFFCVITTIGCGSGKQQLTGKVTFEDGTPVPRGSVVFVQGNSQSRGQIKADGTYIVGTISNKDGIPPGEYKVYLVGVVEKTGGTEEEPIFTSLIDSRFDDAETSGLTYSTTGSKTFDFNVTRKQ